MVKRMRYEVFFALAAALSASAQTIALSHATVIDGTGAAPLRDATIVISGGRIAAIGPAAKVKTPPDAQVIEGSRVRRIVSTHGDVVVDTDRGPLGGSAAVLAA